jgi:DNA-binding HxlR family transcriptional regulator
MKNKKCSVGASIEVFGGKWKSIILFHLLDGPVRFNELQRRTGEITQRMLTKQLRDLEASGLVHREIYPEIPPKVEYSLTTSGKTLKPILHSLRKWGDLYAHDILEKKNKK